MHARETKSTPARAPRPPKPASAAASLAAGGMSPAALMALQRQAGNAAVTRMLETASHVHGAGCGHGQPVQRSAVRNVMRSPGRPLEEPVRAEMEARLGADFSDVRVHTDATAQRSAAELGARAYTTGSHVVIGQGGADKHTLAHELTHVIQQRQGPVAGTDNGSGLKVSDPSDRFERAAEDNARRAMSAPAPAPVQRASPTGAGPLTQREDAAPQHETTAVQRAVGQANYSFADVLPANPRLYSNGDNFWIGSDPPDDSYFQIEQFCAFLATYWLTTGNSSSGLAFGDLNEATRRTAVDIVIGWASQGGSAAQVQYAAQHIHGNSVNLAAVDADAASGAFPVGTRIWFGSDVHAEAAVVIGQGRYLMYDPNTGRATRRDTAGFRDYIRTKNAFVVNVAPGADKNSCCCIIQ